MGLHPQVILGLMSTSSTSMRYKSRANSSRSLLHLQVLDKYWVGQKVLPSFSIRCHGKPEQTFWPSQQLLMYRKVIGTSPLLGTTDFWAHQSPPMPACGRPTHEPIQVEQDIVGHATPWLYFKVRGPGCKFQPQSSLGLGGLGQLTEPLCPHV